MIAGGNEKVRPYRVIQNAEGSNIVYIAVETKNSDRKDTYKLVDDSRNGRPDRITDVMSGSVNVPAVVQRAQSYFGAGLIRGNQLLEDLKRSIETDSLIKESEAPLPSQQKLYFIDRSGQKISVVSSAYCTKTNPVPYIVLETTEAPYFSVFVDQSRLGEEIQKAMKDFPSRLDDSCS